MTQRRKHRCAGVTVSRYRADDENADGSQDDQSQDHEWREATKHSQLPSEWSATITDHLQFFQEVILCRELASGAGRRPWANKFDGGAAVLARLGCSAQQSKNF
jgi:hypothetical protein